MKYEPRSKILHAGEFLFLQDLEDLTDIEELPLIDKPKLKSLGLIKKEGKPVKLLGKGKLSKKIKIEIDAASANAAEAVIKAGGEVIKIA